MPIAYYMNGQMYCYAKSYLSTTWLKTYIERDRGTEGQRDRKTERQRDRERQTDYRQTNPT